MTDRARRCLVPGLLALTLAACGGRQPPAPPERVENPDLGLVIAALPAAFAVADNAGETLRLSARKVAGGEIEVVVGPLQLEGVNLVEEAKQRGAAFEADGVFHGNRELVTPTGTAFTARGELPGPDGPVEETWIFSLHPDGSDRLMTLVYRYPAGSDSQARVGELLEVLGEIEAL